MFSAARFSAPHSTKAAAVRQRATAAAAAAATMADGGKEGAVGTGGLTTNTCFSNLAHADMQLQAISHHDHPQQSP